MADAVAAAAAGGLMDPSAVAVRVGSVAITQAILAHALVSGARLEGPDEPAPVPPEFSACIEQMKVAAQGSPTVPSFAAACAQRYQVLLTKVLGRLIVDQWAIGAARELGVNVSDAAVQAEVTKDQNGESVAQFEATLAATGRTVADLALGIRVQLLEEGIRKVLRARAARVTNAEVVNFYHQHKSSFGVPEQRELGIARVATLEGALKVKRLIASGESFASVVSKLPSGQPIYSSEGVVAAYESGMYHERGLNHAIMTAKPNVLSGPIKNLLGYFIFEVKRVHVGQQKTLAESEAGIRQQLPGDLYEQKLAEFIVDWRKKWTAKTDCQPEYVVAKCRQFRLPAGVPREEEDPYSFR